MIDVSAKEYGLP